jgi:Spy/CpxP family protein refolding chaperone
MRKGLTVFLAIAGFWGLALPTASAKEDVFKGKLFAPDVIMVHQSELELSKQQRAGIRAAVVALRSGVAEYEWDMREAYQGLMNELDVSPIDEKKVVEYAMTAMLAENQVKARQMAMLVQLKNLLTPRQIEYLEAAVK